MPRALLTVTVVAALAGCGGGDPGLVTTTSAPSSTAVTLTTPENTARPTPTPTGKPTFAAELVGESNNPAVGKPWRYTVRVRDSRGRPVAATAKMRVFVEGELVDTICFCGMNGTLVRTHRWPAVLKDKQDVVLQAEVEGPGGTKRVNFPVAVG